MTFTTRDVICPKLITKIDESSADWFVPFVFNTDEGAGNYWRYCW